jgi:long-chain acyl-CoA synthetase
MESVINRVVSGRPSADHSIVFYQAGEQRRLPLPALSRLALRVAANLQRLGIGQGDRIGIIAKNRLEWVLLDLAALRIKAVTAGFEAGKFAADPELIERYGLRLLFTDRPPESGGVKDDRIRSVDRLLAQLDDVPDEPYLAPVAYDPADVTTIKFTSGSTGAPKGLAATVGSIDSSITGTQTLFAHAAPDKLFVFLPLSLLQQRYWIYSALVFGHDVVVSNYELAFWALRREQPTVVMGVPAFYEALRKEIGNRIERLPGDKGGDDIAAAMRRDAAREILGNRIRYLWTGSAPASQDVLRFFTDCGMPIFEGYGMNETCIVTKNAPHANRLGSVGRPLPGKRVALDADGIVIVSSDFPVNTRYLYAAPGDSERIFMPDGSVRTGDLGRIDADGYLYILGRADDVVVLENGHNVLVRPIEERLATCPCIDQCIVVGFGQTDLLAIIYAPHGDDARGAITEHIASINGAVGGDERIGGFVLANQPFSIENGLLTSQYKPRRRAIETRYDREIKTAYGVM